MSDTVAEVFQISKIQTLADGGIRVTLDGPEDMAVKAAVLMEWRRLGFPAQVTFERFEQDNGNGKRQRSARKLHI